MSDMNAKDLIRRRDHVNEAQPTGGPTGPRPNRQRPPGPPGGAGQGRGFSPEDVAEFEEMERFSRSGGRASMRPKGPFSPQELSMVKDLLLLVATEVTGNDYDGKIARKLMKGEIPVAGELQHIIDEVRRVPNLPEQHQQLVQKMTTFVNQGGQAPEAGAAGPGEAPPPAPPEDDLPPP